MAGKDPAASRQDVARPKRSRSISAMSISAGSISSCRRASIPTEATSSAPRSGASLPPSGQTVSHSLERQTMELGLRDYTRADLEAVRAAGERLHIKVVGMARIAPDVPPILQRRQSRRSPSLAPCRPAQPSRKPWPTGSNRPRPPKESKTDEHSLRRRHAAGARPCARAKSGSGDPDDTAGAGGKRRGP